MYFPQSKPRLVCKRKRFGEERNAFNFKKKAKIGTVTELIGAMTARTWVCLTPEIHFFVCE